MSARKIGPYELLELLGEGGIGQVYAARDTVLGRRVAIKMLRAELSRDRNLITRFYQEAQRLGDLSHTNITILHALHLEGREPFMVMELVHGRTLEAVLERVHRIPARESLAIVAQAAAGLAYAHHRGVIHRDIKPSNLMVTDNGLLKITDFGIARVRGTQRLTRAGQMFGTLLYASPEQIRGRDVDERSDLYSLAVLFYEILAGSPPFAADNEHALMTAHLELPPPPLTGRVRDLDPRIEPAVMRALAKNPDDRFASVEEFGRAVGATALRGDAADILQEYLGAAFRHTPPQTRYIAAHDTAPEKPQAGGDGSVPRPRRLRTALRSPIAILGAVAVALALGLGYLVLGASHPSPPGSQVAAAEPSRPAPPQLAAPPPPAPPAPSPAVLVETPAPATHAVPAAPPPMIPPPMTERPKPAPAPSQQPSETPSAAAASSGLGPASVIVKPSATSGNAPTLLPWAPAAKAAAPSATPPQPQPSLALLEPPPRPSPDTSNPGTANPDTANPDIRGTVSGVESTSRIRIGDRWIDLYGIHDPTQRVHTRDVLAFLRPSRGVVECWQKAGARYQCYADGKDLALLALRGGLARPTPDAPAAYRTVSARRAPAHR